MHYFALIYFQKVSHIFRYFVQPLTFFPNPDNYYSLLQVITTNTGYCRWLYIYVTATYINTVITVTTVNIATNVTTVTTVTTITTASTITTVTTVTNVIALTNVPTVSSVTTVTAP